MAEKAAAKAKVEASADSSEVTTVPVIVKGRSLMKEPTTTPAETNPELAPKEESKPAGKALTITPPSEAAAPTGDVSQELRDKTAPESVTPDASAETEPEVSDDPELTEEATEQAAADALASPAGQAQQKRLDKETLEKQQAFDKLVEDKTYFLPIQTVGKRRFKQFLLVTMLLMLVLGVAALAWAQSTDVIALPFLS